MILAGDSINRCTGSLVVPHLGAFTHLHGIPIPQVAIFAPI